MAAQSQMKPLHYGGSLSKSRLASSMPDSKKQLKTQLRYEKVVRLESAGFSEAAIAAMITISVPRLRMLKKRPDYLNVRMRLMHGIILDMDSQLEQVKQQRREMLVQMLPPALQIVANELQAPAITLAERKHKLALAQDILDREGTFAKVSRTEIKPVDHFDFEEADQASRSLVHAIRSGAAPQLSNPVAAQGLDANKEFSNSHTLSAVDQQAALETLENEQLVDDLDAEVLAALPTDGMVN